MTEFIGRIDLRLVRKDFDLDIGFDVPARGVTGIFGPSGCGKTSLLRCIAGLERAAQGSIRINGDVWLDSANRVSVATARRAIGYVFQDGRLFPHLDVRRNLLFGDSRRGARPPVASFDDVVALLGIAHLLARKPGELSGGEQQRVAIGRALLSAPRLLLMDEPLANLDRARKQEILPYLDRLHAELRIPMLYVSHSFNEVVRLCDQLLLLKSGTVRASGELETLLGDLELATELGDMAGVVLPVNCRGWNNDASVSCLALEDHELRVPEALPPGPLRLRVLAGDVSLVTTRPESSSILNILPATVIESRPFGEAMVLVRLDLAGHPLLARISRASMKQLRLAPGQKVFAQIKGVAIRR